MKTQTFIQIRKDMGWSQSELARRLMIDNSTVCRIEGGGTIKPWLEAKMVEIQGLSEDVKKVVHVEPATTDKEWIDKQGACCVQGCVNKPMCADNMDNVFCDECAEQNKEEEPDNWVN